MSAFMARQSTIVMQYYGCVLLWFQLICTKAKGDHTGKVFVHASGDQLLKMSYL